MISSISDQPGEAADVMVVVLNLIGWAKAPLPAESYSANRTDFFRATLHGIWNRCMAKGAVIGKYIAVFSRSVRIIGCPSPEMIRRRLAPFR